MKNSTIVQNIKSSLEDQPTAVKVVVLLTLAAIVFASIALIIGLLSGATAAVFLSAPLVAPKTRRDYFDELPEPYRTQAYENTRKDWITDGHGAEEIRVVLSLPCTGLEDALKGAFVFSETLEGRRYWNRAANGIFDTIEDTTEPTRAKIERILWIALFMLLLFGFFYMVGHTVELVLSLATVLPAIPRNPNDMKIREWYLENYPEDSELGSDIRPSITFNGLFETLDRGKDVYDFLGAHDSVVRERCFGKLAEITQKPYEYIYNQWLNPQ